jgi:hypothetical protein
MLYSGYNGPLAMVNRDADGNGRGVGCLATFGHAGSGKLGGVGVGALWLALLDRP